MQADAQPTPPARVQVDGVLEVHVEDSAAGSKVHYDLLANGRRRRLQFMGAGPQLPSGTRVRVRGVPAGDVLAVESDSTGLLVQGAAAPPASFGVHHTAVILVNFSDKALQPYTTEFARQVVFNDTSNWDLENSHGQTSVDGDVFGWYTIPMASTSCDTTKIASLGKTAATNAGIGLSGYTRFVFAFPKNACTWWGWGQIGGSPTNAWINGSMALRVVAHEMGHNLGLYHAQSLDCGASPIGTSCTSDPYGDVLDTMGGTSTNHFNAFKKERLGWIGSTGQPPVVTVTQSGTYWLDPYELGGDTANALKILKSGGSGSRTFYYVEMRRGLGADSAMRASANLMNGVVVHTGTENNANSSFLLDMTPETPSFSDAALTVGRSFSDPAAHLTVTPLSVSDTGGYVSVTFDVPAVPTLAVTLSTDQTSYLTNQTATATARVSANDAPAAGASVSLTVTLPNGQERSLLGVSDATGQVRFAVKIGKRDPRGTWHLAGTATASGASALAATTFIVQ